MPLQPVRQLASRKFQMNHSALFRLEACGRSMEQEGAHQHRTAFWNATNSARAQPPSGDFLDREATCLVGARYDAKRSLVFVAFVQMQADGQHSGHYSRRRPHVKNTRLHSPRAELRNVSALTNCNCPILVPYHLLIRIRSSVEEDAAHSEAPWPENATDQLLYRWRNRQIANGRNIK